MISQKDINRRQNQFRQKGINEQIKPPQVIQFGELVSKGKGDMRRAEVVENAPHDNIILANIYNLQGIEAIEGSDGYHAEIHCHISGWTGAGYLNESIRRLVTGDIINVEKLPFNNEGTVEQRWYAQEGFQRIDTTMFDIVDGKLSDKLDSCA